MITLQLHLRFFFIPSRLFLLYSPITLFFGRQPQRQTMQQDNTTTYGATPTSPTRLSHSPRTRYRANTTTGGPTSRRDGERAWLLGTGAARSSADLMSGTGDRGLSRARSGTTGSRWGFGGSQQPTNGGGGAYSILPTSASGNNGSEAGAGDLARRGTIKEVPGQTQ